MAFYFSEIMEGGIFVADGFLTQSIPIGTSGDVTITCPAGKRIVLESLWSAHTKTNVSITFGSRLIVDDIGLASRITSAPSDGFFSIGQCNDGSNIRYIQGRVGEDLIINFGVITASSSVEVAYMVGT